MLQHTSSEGIVSSICAYNYNLSKYLTSILGPCIPDKHTTQDSFSFVNEFSNIQSQNKFLISFDVESLFTNIPLSETIDLAVGTILSTTLSFQLARLILENCLLLQLHKLIFCLMVYSMINVMELLRVLPAPILANLFMGYHEEQWIGSYRDSQLLYYLRYIDDTFCLFHNEQDAMKFLRPNAQKNRAKCKNSGHGQK